MYFCVEEILVLIVAMLLWSGAYSPWSFLPTCPHVMLATDPISVLILGSYLVWIWNVNLSYPHSGGVWCLSPSATCQIFR
jgi:hypothetical protein